MGICAARILDQAELYDFKLNFRYTILHSKTNNETI